MNYKIYCLSHNNQQNYESMENRFITLGIPYQMSHGVDFSDPRIANNGIQMKDVKSSMFLLYVWSFRDDEKFYR